MNKNRYSEIDALKGLGIILVVLGHALAGLIDANKTPDADWFRPLFAFIYSFHMPLFFFISGLFVTNRISSSKEKFRSSILKKILIPYFIWGIFQSICIYFASSYVNHPAHDSLINLLLTTIISPPSQFWFLYALFILHFLSYFTLEKVGIKVYFVITLLLASLVEFMARPFPLLMAAFMAPYYGLGILLGNNYQNDAQKNKINPLWLLSLPISILAIVLQVNAIIGIDQYHFWSEKASEIFSNILGFKSFFCASAMIFALCLSSIYFIEKLPHWLIKLGRLSMSIFVLHVLCIASLRIFILRLYPQIDISALLVLLALCGLLLPVIIYKIIRKLGFSNLLGLD